MSNGNPQHVSVRIMDKEYHVSCQPEEKDALIAAAKDLDKRMRQVRTTGTTVLGVDRVAVMVALNLCHELQQERTKPGGGSLPKDVLNRFNAKLDDVLE